MININTSLLASKNYYANLNRPVYIVIHYTGHYAPIQNFCLNIKNNDVNGSAHFFVDDTQIYQSIEVCHGAWAVGDGNNKNGINNLNSINIEMLIDQSFNVTAATEENTIKLVKYLMDKYNINTNNVVRHYDASGKICPNWNANGWQRWNNFKTKIGAVAAEVPKEAAAEYIIKEYPESGLFTCKVDRIYFRNKPVIEPTNAVTGHYNYNESVYYSYVVITNKYVYISWISTAAGVRRYMPITDKTTGEKWGYCI